MTALFLPACDDGGPGEPGDLPTADDPDASQGGGPDVDPGDDPDGNPDGNPDADPDAEPDAEPDDGDRGPIGKADAPGSCFAPDGDRCGGKGVGICFCDDLCDSFGDCCPDYEAVCGGTTQCVPGAIEPADDGCNTCFCNDDGTWSCTELGCGGPQECDPGSLGCAGETPCFCEDDGTWNCDVPLEPAICA